MSRWSESVYSEPNTGRGCHAGFLTQLDRCLYEDVPMDDDVLTAEAQAWSERFLHLRLVGAKCVIYEPEQAPQELKEVVTPSSSSKTSSLVDGMLIPEAEFGRKRAPKLLMRRSLERKAPTKTIANETLPKISHLKIK